MCLGAARAVIVDCKSATEIEITQLGAFGNQVNVITTSLTDRIANISNVGNLAAQVKMQQLQAVEEAALSKMVDNIN